MEHILFVAEYKISGNTGGVGRVGATLAKGFIEKGHKVYYYAVDKTEEDIMNGVPQYYCINHHNITSKENTEHLSDLIKRLGITVIVNHSGFHNKIQQLLAAVKQPGVLLITEHHNCIKCLYDNYRRILTNTYGQHKWFPVINNKLSWFFLKQLFKYRFTKTLRYVLQVSDKLVLLSEAFKKDLEFFSSNIPWDKVTAISNPAPFEVQNGVLDKKENRLLFIGVLKTNQKRVERLIEIWETLSKQFLDWHIDILGEGPEKKMLEDSFKAKGLERYQFHGFKDPRPFLEKAKVFLLTSDFEGFGMVLVESQAYGVVPVAFNCFASVHEIIEHSHNGILIEPYNMFNYTQELALLMTDENKRIAIAQNGMITVQKFSLDKIIGNWEQLFSNIRNNNSR